MALKSGLHVTVVDLNKEVYAHSLAAMIVVPTVSVQEREQRNHEGQSVIECAICLGGTLVHLFHTTPRPLFISSYCAEN